MEAAVLAHNQNPTNLSDTACPVEMETGAAGRVLLDSVLNLTAGFHFNLSCGGRLRAP